MKYKLIVAYDGSNYVGWQIQPNGISIQGLLEQSLKRLLREEIRVIGASRTDAGVHALHQVAHFETESPIEAYKICFGLNAILPRDIRVKEVLSCLDSFHAQLSALRKTYHYHLYRGHEDDPFKRFYHFHYRLPLNLALMRQAATFLEGTHDFTSFANKGSSATSFQRTIFKLHLIEEGQYLRFECTGNGFLYKMVRNLVAVLIEIGKEKMTIADIQKLLLEKERRLAPAPAPARGLFLVKVEYQ